jgi:16S rRNA (adenine1518-N6/adenine1519-N6)-dimethyltransferase
MSLEETKFLLRTHRITPNKLLGQNFMVDASIYPKLAAYANLNSGDVVLDAGAGFGFLTRFLANKCKAVIAVEKDPQIAAVLREQVQGLPNVQVIQGDVLKAEVPPFNKAVAIPPYYLSSQLVTWLLDRGFECAVMILQQEFIHRLVAAAGSENCGWLTVVVSQKAHVDILDEVPNWMFYPPPEVDSIVLRLTPWATPPFTVKDEAFFRRLTRWLFTQRNKKLSNAAAPFLRTERKLERAEAEKLAAGLPFGDRRVRELAPADFGAVADALAD